MRTDGYRTLTLETSGSVLRVTLDRPERRNALSPELVAELSAVVSAAARDSEVSVLILRGAGRSFCSGYDVSTSDGHEHASPIGDVQRIGRENRIFELLWQCPIPTVAQLHGHCLAGGTDLALCCDFVVCATDAVIGYPAVRSMGVPVTHMWLYHLGPQWTKRLLLTGDSVTGVKAAELGLALEAVDAEALDEHVLALANRMALIPRDLLVANKSVVNRGLDLMGRAVLQDVAVTQSVLGRLAPDAGAFLKTAAEKGVRHAVAERDRPFAEGDPVP
jgi:enoyl-CoA hydratase